MRDIEHAYRDAMVAEYEDLVRGGRTEEADHVAEVLADRYGHKIGSGPKLPDAGDAPETTSQEAPPETATPPAPRRGRPPKAANSPKPAGE